MVAVWTYIPTERIQELLFTPQPHQPPLVVINSHPAWSETMAHHSFDFVAVVVPCWVPDIRIIEELQIRDQTEHPKNLENKRKPKQNKWKKTNEAQKWDTVSVCYSKSDRPKLASLEKEREREKGEQEIKLGMER